MFGFRDKKDIKTIRDLEDTITYLRQELEQKDISLRDMIITADLRLKEITRLKNELDKCNKKVHSKVITTQDKIVSEFGKNIVQVDSEGIKVRKRRTRKVAKEEK